MQRELTRALEGVPHVTSVVWMEAAKHIHPPRLKEAVAEQINAMKDDVDVIFLGYGHCNSLKGIDAEFDTPIVQPQMDDCIAILLTPERYAEELRSEVGTWFMTPGWAELGGEMVMKELHMDRFADMGVDPEEMARELFAHYTRGLYIDTGVGDNERFLEMAGETCKTFNDIRLETTVSTSTVLEDHLARCVEIARAAAGEKTPSSP